METLGCRDVKTIRKKLVNLCGLVEGPPMILVTALIGSICDDTGFWLFS